MVRVFALLTGVLGTAAATPPDVAHSRVLPLCRGGDRLALFVATHGNNGSHYVSATSAGLVLLDAAAQTAEAAPVFGTTAVYVDVEGPEHAPARSWSGTPLDGSATLQAWGTTDCTPLGPGVLPDAQSGPLVVDLESWQARPERSPDALVLRLGTRTRSVAGLRLLAPDAAWGSQGHDPVRAPTGGGARAASIELELMGEGESTMVAGAPIVLENHVLVPVAVADPLYSSTLYAAVGKTDFLAARAWLLNATGLDRHRAGDHRLAARWFQLAVEAAPDLPLYRFNLACAWARHGDVDAVVDVLGGLGDAPGMKAKVAADKDFDGVREDPRFQEVFAALH